MQFTHPWAWLWLALLLPYTIFFSRRSLAGLEPWRAHLALGLRLLVLVGLVLALSGMQLVRHPDNLCVVYTLDVSDSISPANRERALEFIRRANERMRPNDQAGLVVFGAQAYVEALPQPGLRVERLHSRPNGTFTNLAAGLRLALAILAEGAQPRIVLLSDGNENRGEARREARLAQARGVPVEVVPLTYTAPQEARVEKVTLPAEVKRGEPFEIRVVVRSETAGPGRLSLLRDGLVVAQQEVALTAGKSVFALPQTLTSEGFHSFEALLEPARDTWAENNRALGFTFVRGTPKVLYIEGERGQEKYLTAALRAAGLRVEVVPPEGLPTELAAFGNYEAIILSDVNALRLSGAQMEMLRSSVRDLGVGLVMIGGENSFGVGGYFQTPVEEALPVSMDVRRQRHWASVGLVVIIDKSGSMAVTEYGVQKIFLANEAAAAAVELLQPYDRVGVIACDSGPQVVVGLVSAENKEALVNDIATIRAGGGGIYVRASLERAYQLLASANTRLKHIILLADGNDAEQQEGCRELVQRLAGEKITLSVVSIGEGVDVPFLQDLAALGRGRFYLTTQASHLPRIFTQEALLAARSPIVEEEFLPLRASGSEILRGLEEFRPLKGYVATTPKPLASVPLVSPPGDPILAVWHCGLGRSVAFTSDCKARWGAYWVTWERYSQFWGQVVRWCLRRTRPGLFEARVVPKRGQARVLVEAVDERGQFLNGLTFHATAVGPDFKSVRLELEQTAPGRYEGTFALRGVGVYLVNVGQEAVAPNQVGAAQTVGFALSYSPEYLPSRSNEVLLRRLAEMTNGRVLHSPQEVFARRGGAAPVRVPQDLWAALLTFALGLFPLDIAVRRLRISWAQVAAGAAAVSARWSSGVSET
ncbi:MAG TPA: VWA domain-containing protein, partial [Armatimonadetes bacterium]|nr:VWA domain-containing protein [Armatimonadota bacterium]